ncbi:RNA polymerase sigma factor [Sinomicrobium sp. M5D2P9]
MNADLTIGDNLFEGAKEHDTNSNEISDTELWLKFQGGDQVAFEEIYAQNFARLYNYGLKLATDRDLVKDSIQDLFEELWDRREKLGKVKSIKSYLFKSIRRKILRKAGKKGKLLSLVESDDNVYMDSTPSSEITMIANEQFELEQKELELALNKLNKKHREIIHLMFYEHLSYKEIAKVTGMHKKNVYYHMSRALDILYISLKKLL